MQNVAELKSSTGAKFKFNTKDKVIQSKDPEGRLITKPIQESLKAIAPSWPLQSTVAVNPFWFNIDRNIVDVFQELSPILNQNLFMPFSYYHQKFQEGGISSDALKDAVNKVKLKWPDLKIDADELIKSSKEQEFAVKHVKSITEFVPTKDIGNPHLLIKQDLGKYCAAYFDDNQALARYPWHSGLFWDGWFEAQRFDRSMETTGIKTFRQTVEKFRGKDPEAVVQSIFEEFGINCTYNQYVYAQKLLVDLIGWSSQFKYIEWQKSLGYEVERKSTLIELLAVRMIYDFAYFKELSQTSTGLTENWLDHLKETSNYSTDSRSFMVQLYAWQLAAEMTNQSRIAASLSQSDTKPNEQAKYQMVFCIDVRSEMIRRNIETTNSEIQTMGFAGFFGAPLDYKKSDEKEAGHRLPVLLPPAYDLEETSKTEPKNDTSDTVNSTMIASYFKNLRKASIGSFLYVEIFGILTIFNFFTRAFKSLSGRLKGNNINTRFPVNADLQTEIKPTKHKCLPLSEKVGRSKAILQHMGLKDGFGRLVVMCGHGAETTNNALASALDCGACGGHAGDVNARFVVGLLNQKQVREELKKDGIHIPDSTRFIAGVHETVTDAIYILEDSGLPEEFMEDVKELKESLKEATERTVAERNTARSNVIDINPHRRAASWAEVRPEWGLAGNAQFIVAPRSRSKGINLNSRAFLHDYNWEKDEGFQTLELIMTAPMVVTNWINMQYYSSVVAPDYFGCGNKILHNVTGENGVVEGNGGDLRVGLSMQSVHDGKDFVHEPLRLSVYIEAPKEAIEEIIENHKVVKDLIDNEWLYLLHIEPNAKLISRRLPGGIYEKVAN